MTPAALTVYSISLFLALVCLLKWSAIRRARRARRLRTNLQTVLASPPQEAPKDACPVQ